jgi:signal transduction histidine kinase
MPTSLLCPDSTPSVFGIFDFSIAPSLLFYSYIPIFVISLIFGFYVLSQDRKKLLNNLFLGITLSFASWIFLIFFQWTAVQAEVVHLAWQLLIVPEILIYLLTSYFIFVALQERDVSILLKIIYTVVLLIIFILLPTTLNIEFFDLVNCEGTVGSLWNFIYIIELISFVSIAVFSLEQYRVAKKNIQRSRILLLGLGTVFFLSIFWASNFFGEITKTYEINLIGPIGMILFLTSLTYGTLHFKVFKTKLIVTQALVVVLLLLIFALLFITKVALIRTIVICTLLLTLPIGMKLVQSVRKEIEQREKIEKLAQDLQLANEGQSNLIHIMNHQIKGYLSKSRNIFSELLSSDSDYGPIGDNAKPLLKEGLDSLTEGVGFVQQVLHGSAAESGQLIYSMDIVDFKQAVEEVAEHQKNSAESKHLEYEVKVDEGTYKIKGDNIQLREAIRNLIDNSILYTPKGSLKIHLSQKDDSLHLEIKDTGLGISSEDMPRLFTKGGRGKDSLKVNVNSTGYGLAFVKAVVEAHHGKVWVESEGCDKGSTFFLELPLEK